MIPTIADMTGAGVWCCGCLGPGELNSTVGASAKRGGILTGSMAHIQGAELGESLFFELGLRFLSEHYPEYVERIAAGVLGQGSEAMGFDDELSRDHSWEPRFNLIMTQDDYAKAGEEIESKLRASLPSSYRGFKIYLPKGDIGATQVQGMDHPATGAAPVSFSQYWSKSVARGQGTVCHERQRSPCGWACTDLWTLVDGEANLGVALQGVQCSRCCSQEYFEVLDSDGLGDVLCALLDQTQCGLVLAIDPGFLERFR